MSSSEERGSESITRKAHGWAVAPSPFNGVKLELAVILIVGLLLVLLSGRLFASLWWQWLVPLGFGCAGALWIVWRVRAVAARITHGQDTA